MYELCIFLICFWPKFFFFFAEINLTTLGPLYTCLVFECIQPNRATLNYILMVCIRCPCVDDHLLLCLLLTIFLYFPKGIGPWYDVLLTEQHNIEWLHWVLVLFYISVFFHGIIDLDYLKLRILVQLYGLYLWCLSLACSLKRDYHSNHMDHSMS